MSDNQSRSQKRALVQIPRMSAMLTYPRSNTRDPGHYAELRITDEDANQLVASIELNPDQLFNLMANATAYGVGQANTNGHRFGLHYEHSTLHLDREEWGLAYNSDESHPAIQAHLAVSRDVEGWEVVTYESKRGQHYIHRVRWVNAAPEEAGGA